MNKHWPNGLTNHGKKRRKRRKPLYFFRESNTNKDNGGNKMTKFWELVKSSVIVQGTVTLVLVGTTCYLYASGQDVPESLLSLDGLVIGFFFGSKSQQIAARGR